MAIRKRGKSYQATVYVQGRRIASKTFQKLKDAKAFETKVLSTHKPGDEVTGKYRFDQLIEVYKARHLSTKSMNTQKRYGIEIDSRLLPRYKGWRLDKITASELELFKLELRSNSDDPRSINYTLEVLRAILNKGVKWRYLVFNPVSEIEFLPVGISEKDWLNTKEEINAVMREAERTNVYPVILLALESGLRIGEILGLQNGDFDFATGNIRVVRQWLDKEQDFGPPKHRIERYVPMSQAIASIFAQASQRLPKGLVFVSKRGLPPRQSTIYDAVTAVTQKAIGRKLGAHAFRHTFGSWYMRVHDDMWTLSRLMGHADTATTRKYCHQGTRHKAPALNLTPIARQIEGLESNKAIVNSWLSECSGRDLNASRHLSVVS